MSFTPPFFSKFGKSYNDLSKKKFDYSNTAKISSTTASGLTLETTGVLGQNSVSAKEKVTQKDSSFGETTLEVCTKSGKFTTSAKATQLVDGATFELSGGYCPPCKSSDNTGFFAKLNGDYSQEFFAGTSQLTVNDRGNTSPAVDLQASAVIGAQGMSVGGAVRLDLTGADTVKDYNLGVQYSASDFTAALVTSDRADTINASVYHKMNRNQQVGVAFNTNPFKGTKELTFATQYAVDVDTTVKAKFSSNGTIGTAVEHQLQNPRLKYNVAAEFNTTGASIPQASRFGVGVTFGQF